MDRVVVTRPIVGICLMQVCAEADTTDEEILAVCNCENPSGTTNGWSKVIRVAVEGSMFETDKALPATCADDSSRLHFLVLC